MLKYFKRALCECWEKRISLSFYTVCILLLFSFTFHLHSAPIHLFLKGYLSHEIIAAAEQKLQEGKKAGKEEIIIQINSSSGEIHEVLNLVHELYQMKTQGSHHVVVYIQGKAVGPAAILPFLADKLIVTPLVSWGDIFYGVREHMNHSVMQNNVTSLIHTQSKSSFTLTQLVYAMTDPYYRLVYEGRYARIEKKDDRRFDPLVLNLQGIESLGLVDQVLSDEDFQKKYISEKSKSTQMIKITRTDEIDQRLRQSISYHEKANNFVGYIHIGIDRPIDQSTYIYVKFALKEFIKKEVCLIVLDLNTPGGEVLSALKIVDLLQKIDVQHHIPVIAFIDDWAVSAGAMLAYSCRFIGIGPNSLMGAAEPVQMERNGQMTSSTEKVNSALRAQFANLATFYNRNPLIAEAMVDKDSILVLRNHKIIQLHSKDEIYTSDPNPDTIITEKGKLLTLNAKQLIEYGVADFEIPSTALPEINTREREEGMWPAKKIALFQQSYLSQIPYAIVIDYRDWRITFFSILSHPIITALLLIGLIVGLYIEVNTPGFGIFGSIGIGCLTLIILTSFASQAINWIEIIILCMGLILLALELFVIPGFGITGILGIILTVIGLFSLMLPEIGHLTNLNIESFYLIGSTFIERLAWLCGAFICSIVIIIILAKFCSQRYFRFSRLVLQGEQEKKAGYFSGMSREMMPHEGDLGETMTPLRPSGKVHIGDNLFDAISQGKFLDSHTAIEVIRTEGSKVVVRPIQEEKL